MCWDPPEPPLLSIIIEILDRAIIEKAGLITSPTCTVMEYYSTDYLLLEYEIHWSTWSMIQDGLFDYQCNLLQYCSTTSTY